METPGKKSKKEEPPKKFLEHKKTTSVQIGSFDLASSERGFSHTIDLYDFLPKYVWGKVERVEGIYLPRLEREFESRGEKYILFVHPASITDKDGREKYYYPTKREDVVEDALRKIMAEKQGFLLDGEAAMSFSIYQLSKELKENGHKYDNRQIKDAINVLAKTTIELKSSDDKVSLIFHLIEAVGYKGVDDETHTFVKFSPLVTKSIKENTFRSVNYKKVMSYKHALPRQLHKRMAHHYTQASLTDPYTILLTTIIRDFGLTRRKQLKDNLRELEEALAELKNSDVVINYILDKIIEKSPRFKLADVKVIIQPHFDFVTEVKRANARRKIETVKIGNLS